ncbi:hypothetical protein TNCV_1919581 [Trichonephila clavipes]|nr:hypothetical protein TNCV_1919581 [Trichonephila clavipes]
MISCIHFVTNLETMWVKETINILCIEECPNMTHNMWPCLILLEDGVWQASKTGFNYWTYDIPNVPICIQITVDPNWNFVYCILNGCRNHHNRCTSSKPILNASRRRTVNSEPPGTYVYGHQITALRTGYTLKRRNCTIPVSTPFKPEFSP